jgi:hypothetical protein
MMQVRLRESCLRPRRSRSGASRRALLAFGLASLALPNLALPASAQRSGLLTLRATFGERGPEIVNLPRGSSVTPNNRIGGNVVSINVNVPAGTNGASADRIALVTGQAVQRALRRNG